LPRAVAAHSEAAAAVTTMRAPILIEVALIGIALPDRGIALPDRGIIRPLPCRRVDRATSTSEAQERQRADRQSP
jgi:hypothetical protein